MARTAPFEEHTDRYEDWFETHASTYESEVRALARHIDADDFSLEVGVGTGRFATPLGIDVGVDPAEEMLRKAVDRDVTVVRGVAEELPFRACRFDLAMLVTTICFVDDIPDTLREAGRVLVPGGRVVLGYIDRESVYGRHYQDIKDQNPFYRDATFVATDELLETLDALGFAEVEILQTVFEPPGETEEVSEPRAGYGEGSFVALSATAPE